MVIAVCENDAADSAAICEILNRYMEQNGYAGEVRTFESGEDLLSAFSLGAFDVIFLDIYMGGISGIETAKRIRRIDPTCALIFITSSPDHALEGFSVRASAYAVKPIREKDLQTALFQCREIFLRNARYMEIRADRVDMRLPLIKIVYIEMFDKSALFHTTNGVYKTRMTMDEIERYLGGKPFYRCHQSYIVNMNHIEQVEGQDILMKDGSSIPVRQRGREEIRTDIAHFLSNRMFEVQ